VTAVGQQFRPDRLPALEGALGQQSRTGGGNVDGNPIENLVISWFIGGDSTAKSLRFDLKTLLFASVGGRAVSGRVIHRTATVKTQNFLFNPYLVTCNRRDKTPVDSLRLGLLTF
jgi:hypothetical protein